MLNNDYIERRSFAAKVEGMMKRDVEDSAANQPAASFDFDSFIDQFESTQTAAPAAVNTEAVVAPAIPVYLKNAEERAALTGKFHPDELFGNEIAEVDKIAVLSFLAPECNIDTVTEIFWFLQQQRRTEILQQLLSTGVLKEKAKAKFTDHDCFGKMLRAVILDGAGINLNMLKL